MIEQKDPHSGTILSVRGSVVDMKFPHMLPPINSELLAGDNVKVVIEVLTHLNPETVREVALTPTRGLYRSSPVTNTGHPLSVPVGRQLLGRMLNVFGETIDRKNAIEGAE